MMLRVLHCIYDDPLNPWVGGGGAVRVRELYGRLREQVEATVVTGSFPGSRDEVHAGLRYRRLGGARPYAWSRLSFAYQATRLLRQASYDAAVFDFSSYAPVPVPRDRPVGITVHHVTGPTAGRRWGRVLGTGLAALERRVLRRARILSATSSATEQLLRDIVPPGSRIVPVGAGVDDSLFELSRAEEDFVLYFGRLDWFQKGLDVLLDAAALLMRDDPALELRLAGRGRDLPRVEAAATRLGIRDRVALLGPVTEAERLRLFAGAKVLLMPSRFEGFGMVAAEAMAAGVPVVAATSGSLPEVIAAPDGGVLVPADDAEALAAAVAGLLGDGEARRALSRSARTSAERFRWRVVADQHLNFLRQIAAGSGAARPSEHPL